MTIRNKLLADIVVANGGTVTNPSNRNQLLRDWLAAVSSTDAKNGDVIAINGSGFGATAADLIIWDTVDNQGDTYDSLADGSAVPLRGAVPTAPYYDMHPTNDVTLASTDTYSGAYGARSRVYAMDNGAAHLGRPELASTPNQGNASLYGRFYIKDSGDPFGGSANKFFRAWDDTAGSNFLSACSNNQLAVRGVGGVDLRDDIVGTGAANRWILVEYWLSSITKEAKTRYFNIETQKLSDVGIDIVNPAANGFIASLFGYDDGDDDSSGRTWKMSEIYWSRQRRRVELCSSPNWNRALYREIQQVTSWSDNSVSFVLDGLNVDPANCWAILLDDNENVLATKQIGNPTAIEQDIKRPIAKDGSSLLYSGATSSGAWEYETSFLMTPSVTSGLTGMRFVYDGGFSNRILYDVATESWEVRSGGGTVINFASTRGGLDDGLEHVLKVVSTGTDVAIYIDDILDGSGSGTLNALNLTQLFRPVSATTGQTTIHYWNTKITDSITGTNSRYWKFDEQVGRDTNHHIREYAQDTEGSSEISLVEGWEYLPNEGY